MKREFKSTAPLTGLKSVIGRKMANKLKDIKNAREEPETDDGIPSAKTEKTPAVQGVGSIVNRVMAAKLAKCKLSDPR